MSAQDAVAVAKVQGYQYVVLRCVPRIDKEEFSNVAIVLYSQLHGFLDLAVAPDLARRTAMVNVDEAEVRGALAVMASACAAEPPAGLPNFENDRQRFGWLSSPRNTVVQPGPMHGGVTRAPSETLEALAQHLFG